MLEYNKEAGDIILGSERQDTFSHLLKGQQLKFLSGKESINPINA